MSDPEVMRPAMPELIALASAVRPDWSDTTLRDALVACHQAGWPWSRTLREVAGMLCDAEAAPRDLLLAARSPLKRYPPPPGTSQRGAARARELLAARSPQEQPQEEAS